MFSDLTLPLEAAGLRLDIREDVGPVLEEPVRTAADVARLRRFRAADQLGNVLDEIRLLRSELRVPLLAFAGGPFTLATYAVEGGASKDMARTRAFLRRDPAAWAALLDFFADVVGDYLVDQARAGAQAVQVFDSWNGVLAPGTYRASVLAPTRRVFERLRAEGVPSIHFGTGNPALLPCMAEAGGDAIGVDWRIPLDDAWRAVGHDRAVQGNLDPAALLAPREALLAEAADVLRRAGGRPGHVFNLCHGIPRETDPEQVAALVDFVHGWEASP
jgi:uroporphyrinogen decarboxylase